MIIRLKIIKQSGRYISPRRYWPMDGRLRANLKLILLKNRPVRGYGYVEAEELIDDDGRLTEALHGSVEVEPPIEEPRKVTREHVKRMLGELK